MPELILRDTQKQDIEGLRNAFRQHRRVLYVAGTGSGKTVVANWVMRATADRGRHCWFLAHRRELIEQTADKLHDQMGTEAGIIMAGHRLNRHRQIQVASVGTLYSRLILNDRLKIYDKPYLIVTDEAHHSAARSYRKLYDLFPNAYFLGLTATPARADGVGLGHQYDAMVQAPSVRELIELGYLVRPRYFAGNHPRFDGIRTRNYDFHKRDLEERLNTADLRGDVVEQWLRHGDRRKTVVFSGGGKHTVALTKDFRAAGVRAEFVTHKTPPGERFDLIQKFRNTNEIEVMVNFGILTEGFDCPEIACVSIATATKSIVRYLQMAGRSLRPSPGKFDCILIDHGDNIIRHGFVDDDIPWTLETTGRISDRIAKARKSEPRQFVCSVCGCVFAGRVRCPECGTRLEPGDKHGLISTAEELIEVTRGAAGQAKTEKGDDLYTTAEKRRFFSMLKHYSQEKGFAKGWASHIFRSKFGTWPEGYDDGEPEPPNEMVTAYIRGRLANHAIRKQKQKEKQERANAN